MFSLFWQYTAEYVKDHLFPNTVEKIKQLRTQLNKQGDAKKNGNNNVGRSNSGKISSSGGKKTEKRGSVSNEKIPNSCVSTEKRGSVGEETGAGGFSKELKQSCTTPTKSGESEIPQEKIDKDKKSQEHTVSESSVTENEDCKKDASPSSSGKGSGVENITQDSGSSSSPASCEVSMKKDDTYSSVNLKKRNSLTSSTASTTTTSKEKREETSAETLYIDSYKNINYTRLLTDQIITVDKQVVAHCKSRTDMSGKVSPCLTPH